MPVRRAAAATRLGSRRIGRSWRRRELLRAAEMVAIGLLGALLGLLVAGQVTTDVGPFEAKMSLHPAVSGNTTVDVPPLGQLQLDTHSGPVHLDVGITRLRPDAARAVVADPGSLRDLGSDVHDDVLSGLVELLVRTAVVTLVGAAALGLLVFRAWRPAAVATGAGLAVLVGVGAWAGVSVNERALTQPRFSGLLAVAPTVVGDVRTLFARFDVYSLQLGRLVTNVSELYTTTSTVPVFSPTDDTVRVLHVSDLHLNPAAFDVIASVVEQFQVDVVVDTGDITDFGSAAERQYVAGISGLDVPYVYVRGNHDSGGTQTAVAAQPNAVVLDSTEIVEVAGLRLLGMGDPRFTPDKTTGDDDAPDSQLTAVGRTLRRSVRTALEPPDLVAVHDPRSAEPLLGEAPVVLAGHTHERKVTEEDDTLLMVQGSTGGAGLRALEGDQPTPISLSVLYVDPTTGRLQAYDDITLGGLGTSDARISRHVVAPVEPDTDPTGGPTADPTDSP